MSYSNQKIVVKDLAVHCILGVHDFERERPQKIIVTLEFTGLFEKAQLSDQLEDTLDYDSAATTTKKILREGKFKLLESAAHHIAQEHIKNSLVKSVLVRVCKPGAVTDALGAYYECVLSQ